MYDVKRKTGRLAALLLALCLAVAALPLGIWAEETPAEVRVSTVEDLLRLAEDCRLDSWSQGRTVRLEADIDLAGAGFGGIPTFGGTFEGQGHSITGLALQGEGSVQGLFRYLQQGAVVRNLAVQGSVAPAGSRCTVGGIVGQNAGTLQGCSFTGLVHGADIVGGLVGKNEATGLVESCRAVGVVYGSHFVGGLVGDNHGVVRGSANDSNVNTTPEQNQVELEDLTLESLTGTETAADATDLGGIAGMNSGVVRGCVNRGTVGYLHVGYNVGGIAGSQTGYIEGCVNYGSIYARKEGGGIVGQMEPSSTLQYRQDALQQLRGELDTLKELTDQACADAETANSALAAQLNRLQAQVDSARSALDALVDQTADGVGWGTQTITTDLSALLPADEPGIDLPALPTPQPTEPPQQDAGQQAHGRPRHGEPATPETAPTPEPTRNTELTVEVPSLELTNRDGITAARNDLSGSLAEIVGSVGALNAAGNSGAQALIDDIRAITEQMNKIGNTLLGAADTGDGTVVEDVSDQDSEQDTEGKVTNCVNQGAVEADRNAGGIAGAMAPENDLDPEDDIRMVGDSSLDFTYQARAVLRGCENRGTVRAKKQGAGGIVGSMEMGSVLDCFNRGAVDAATADCVGGVAGSSSAVIRGSSAKCTLAGAAKVGGIAGSGATITGCRSMVRILAGTEQLGAVAGTVPAAGLLPPEGEEPTLAGNLFLPNATAPGGIDGISYAGIAEPMEAEAFLALEGLPQAFGQVTLRFVADGTTLHSVTVPYGGAVAQEELPAPPTRQGYTAEWQGLAGVDLGCLTFDETLEAAYTPLEGALQSGQARADGRAVLVAEGDFAGGDAVVLEPLADAAPTAAGCTPLESWRLALPGGEVGHRLHYLPPEGASPDGVCIYLRGADGSWRAQPCGTDGSYLVFETQPGDDAFCAQQLPPSPLPTALVGGALALALAAALLLHRKRRHGHR